MRVLVSEKLSPHRFKTPEGYLICTDAILARTGKQTYRRREVFGDMSDKGEEEIEINRDEKEVFNPVTLASFENKPLTIEHPNEDVNPENHHDYAVGFTRDIKRGRVDGNDVMLGTIVVTDAEAIKDIESGELVELSCGYDCDVVDEANPQQRNIRGNHVALCERGRAGIARIVDSVKDDKMSELKSILHRISKMYSNDPGIEFVLKELTNAGYDVSVDSIDGWLANRNVPGEYIKKYRLDVNIDGKEHHILAILYADEGTWKVKEINAYMTDSMNDALKIANCSGYAIVEKKKFDQYGQNAIVEARTDSLDEARYLRGSYNKQGNYIIVNCKTKQMEDMKDMDYSKESKQGFKVLEMYRDGGRLHAILKRANDYVVALGYDTSDGTWAQGRYVDKYENALATLREEKPGAKKIQDCDMNDDLEQSSSKEAFKKNIATEIEAGKDPKQAAAIAYSVQRANDAKDRFYTIGTKLKNGNDILTVVKTDDNYIYLKHPDGKVYAYNAYDLSQNLEMSPKWSYADSIKDSIDNILNKIRTTQIKEGEQLTFEAEGYLIDIQSVGKDVYQQRSDKRWASPKTESNAWIRVWKDNQKVFDESGPINVARDRLIQFMKTRVNDSLKKFEVKYTKDSKTYVQIVKAKDLTDAINKVKDAMAVPFASQSEAQAAMREIEPLYQRAYQNTMQRFTIGPWRNGYEVTWEREIGDPSKLQRLIGNKYVLTRYGVYKGQ